VPQTDTVHEDSLHGYLRVLNRRKVTIVLVTLLMLGAAVAYVQVRTPVYSASAQVLVPEQSAAAPLQLQTAQQEPSALNVERILSDAQQFAEGNQTATAARAILHRTAHVSISASNTDDVLSFSASSTVPAEAAAIANAFARAYIAANLHNEVTQYTAQVSALRASIANLQVTAASLPTASQQRAAALGSITTLTQSLQDLQATIELSAESGPSVINAAALPSVPSSPKKVRDAALGLIIGLLLAVGLALLKDRFDDKVASMSDVEEISGGLPVVGTIPLVNSWRKGTATHIALREDPESTVSEAYRTLRTSIQFLGLDDAQRVIGITSSTPDEGKTTAAANLAVSFARAGSRVVVVSFDFRRPRLHLFFGHDNKIGATSVLLGHASLADALHEVPGEPDLRVLTSGPVPPNPAEILSLDRVRQLVDVLAHNADVVLLDCPPVLPVTDTLLISRLCDTMLVVTVAAAAKRSDLRRTYELLSQVQAPLRGTIVNRVPHRGAYASGYGYGYGYGYRYKYTPKDGSTSSDRSDMSSRSTTVSEIARIPGVAPLEHIAVDSDLPKGDAPRADQKGDDHGLGLHSSLQHPQTSTRSEGNGFAS
jgi:capsular exopolysaccharide synthesis family protein